MRLSPAAAAQILMLAIAPGALALSAAPEPAPGAPVVVLTAPWTDAAELAVDAGGLALAPGRVAATVLAWGPDPDFAAALRAAGAWAVLPSDLSGFFCGAEQ